VNQIYLDTARLLTQVAPLVFEDGTFALKGGTAINLFLRDMPRLSVDLELVFPDHSLPRDIALDRINAAVRQCAERLARRGFQTHAPAIANTGETKLLVRRAGIEVKVEVNFVMRGTVHPVRTAAITTAARQARWRTSRFRSYRWRTHTAESWLRPWIGSTPGPLRRAAAVCP